jgi:hypothetical protein
LPVGVLQRVVHIRSPVPHAESSGYDCPWRMLPSQF